MQSPRIFQLLLLLVAVVLVAHASVNDNVKGHAMSVVRRQATGTEDLTAGDKAVSGGDASGADTGGDSTDPTEDVEDPAPTPGDDKDPGDNTGGTGNTEDPVSSSSVPSSSSSEVPSSSASQPPKSTSEPAAQSTSESSSSSEAESSSTKSEPSSTAKDGVESKTSAPPKSTSSEGDGKKGEEKTTFSKVVTTKFEVVTKTNEDGSKQTMTSTTKSTGSVALNADDSDDGEGMPDSTRNTIIGVVVGIGGAIVLGAIALVARRIWGRRKRAEENDALMDYDPNRGFSSSPAEKNTEPPSTAGGSVAPSRSPFQQTLDNYHQPTQVNASSNF